MDPTKGSPRLQWSMNHVLRTAAIEHLFPQMQSILLRALSHHHLSQGALIVQVGGCKCYNFALKLGMRQKSFHLFNLPTIYLSSGLLAIYLQSLGLHGLYCKLQQ